MSLLLPGNVEAVEYVSYFVTAQKILDYRQEHGAFHSVDELDAVPGIGPKRLDQLRELVVP